MKLIVGTLAVLTGVGIYSIRHRLWAFSKAVAEIPYVLATGHDWREGVRHAGHARVGPAVTTLHADRLVVVRQSV